VPRESFRLPAGRFAALGDGQLFGLCSKLLAGFLIGHIEFSHEGVIAAGVWMAVAKFG
jgi:hypothetical protein